MAEREVDFQKIYDAFQPKILRYVTRLIGENESEDLIQEIFVKVSSSARKLSRRIKIIDLAISNRDQHRIGQGAQPSFPTERSEKLFVA